MTQLCFILAFGFVTPAFAAAGALLVSLPIIIHLLNRRRFKTVEWAAMEFLLRALRKNRRRIRFEQWLLLAVRCSVLMLLGLALARPLGCEDASLAALAARRTGLHVIVVDNSYSMMYEADRPEAKTHLDQAKLLAKRLIDRFRSGGEAVVVITAARPATAVLAPPTFDAQAARSAVDRIEQSYAATDLTGALELASRIAREETRLPNKTLYLLTDATRSAWQVPQQEQAMQSLGRELSRAYQQIVHFDLSKGAQANSAVVKVEAATNLIRVGYQNDLVARLQGFGNVREGLLQWRLDEQVLPGQNNVTPQLEPVSVTQAKLQLSRGGPHVVSVSFAGDDRLKVDDTRSCVIDVASDLKVLIVEGDRGSASTMGGSGTWVMEALAPADVDRPGGKRTGSYLAPELISDLEFGNKVLADYRAIILAGVGQISANQADQLKHFVETGGTLMLFMGEPVNAENYNANLLPRGLLPGALAKRVSATAGREPFYLDFKPNAPLHPLLKKFENITNSGIERAPVLTYWQIDVPRESKVETILKYQPDEKKHVDPAIMLHELGHGHVLTFSTSADLEWSALPGRLNFAPLLHELLSGTMTAGDAWMNLTVGESLRIPPSLQLTAAPALKDSQQVDIVIEQSTGPNGEALYHSRPIAKPGLYTLVTGNTKFPIAVNVPAEEGDIRPVDNNAIRKALGDIDVSFERDQLPAVVEQAQTGNDFGWSVMMVVLAMVGLECFLAMKFGHYKRT